VLLGQRGDRGVEHLGGHRPLDRLQAGLGLATASTTAAPCSSTASRWSRHACVTARRAARSRRGEVRAAEERLAVGVANTVIGQPPCPVIAWVAVM
jgi:hypothetical protein